MQKLIEVLKVHRDTAFEKEKQYEDLVLTEYYEGRAKAFEDAISFAELHLETEKEVMCKFADNYVEDECFASVTGSVGCDISTEEYFEKTFKTKER